MLDVTLAARGITHRYCAAFTAWHGDAYAGLFQTLEVEVLGLWDDAVFHRAGERLLHAAVDIGHASNGDAFETGNDVAKFGA